VSGQSLTLGIIRVVLAIALLGGLVAAGAGVYRRLPVWRAQPGAIETGRETQVTIVLRDTARAAETTVELFPIDFGNLEHDFVISGRPGRTFEEFLWQRLKDLSPVRAQFDTGGRAVARVGAGNWWLRALSSGQNGEMSEWRLALNISRPALTVELSADNVYERTKKF